MNYVNFIIFILYIIFIIINISLANYCTISLKNVRCENTTVDEFNLLVNSYKNNLQNMSIKYSGLKSIPEKFLVGYDSLLHMDLESNGIININSGVFINLDKLQTLSLENNLLVAVSFGMFDGLSSLEYLNLANNSIHYINYKSLHNLYKLKTVILSHNKLQRLHTDIFCGDSVGLVDLSWNQIDTLIPHISGHKTYSLTNLDLSHNRISIIPSRIFSSFENLERLNLSHNNLDAMDFVEQLVNVRHLDISYNKITAFNEIKLRSLEFLDLTNNLIKTIDIESVKVLPNLHELYLRRNRMDCRWFTENYDKMPSAVVFQTYEMLSIPERVGVAKQLVYECSTRLDGEPSMILVKGTQGPYAAETSSGSSETRRDANEFGFFEIYFWLTAGTALVFTTTVLCRKCMKHSEEKQKQLANSQQEEENERSIIYTYNVSKSGSLKSYDSKSLSTKSSGDVEKRVRYSGDIK